MIASQLRAGWLKIRLKNYLTKIYSKTKLFVTRSDVWECDYQNELGFEFGSPTAIVHGDKSLERHESGLIIKTKLETESGKTKVAFCLKETAIQAGVSERDLSMVHNYEFFLQSNGEYSWRLSEE